MAASFLCAAPRQTRAAGSGGASMRQTLNQGVLLILSGVQLRYGSAFSHQRRLHADLDIFSLSPLRPFRLLHMFQIRTSVVGRRPHNTVSMRGTVARIGAESVRPFSGAGLLPRLENFRCLCAAITANPPPPHALPLAHPDFSLSTKGANGQSDRWSRVASKRCP